MSALYSWSVSGAVVMAVSVLLGAVAPEEVEGRGSSCLPILG